MLTCSRTLQELALFRRMLVFIAEQAFFYCPKGMLTESTQARVLLRQAAFFPRGPSVAQRRVTYTVAPFDNALVLNINKSEACDTIWRRQYE
jgi:hypothetical protein